MLNNTNTAATLSTLATELSLPTTRRAWEETGTTRSLRARVTVTGVDGAKHGTLVYVMEGGDFAGVQLDGEERVDEWHAAQIATSF